MAYGILGFSFPEGVTVFIWLERTTLLAVKFRSYAGAGVYIANTLFLPQFLHHWWKACVHNEAI